MSHPREFSAQAYEERGFHPLGNARFHFTAIHGLQAVDKVAFLTRPPRRAETRLSPGVVLASLRGSTYGLGARLFRQAMGGRVNTVTIFASSLTAALLDGHSEQPAGH